MTTSSSKVPRSVSPAPTDQKWVYLLAEGNAGMRDLLGGKGAGLAEMTNLGLSVPPGFTITTEACNAYSAEGDRFPVGLWDQVEAALAQIETATGKRLGDVANPLLLSVRSGARFSMPGMMDTVLNLGLNAATRAAIADASGNPRFAADAYRRFIQMYGKIVLDVSGEEFEELLEERKQQVGAAHDTDLSAADLEEVIVAFKALVREQTGEEFPAEPREQLRCALAAVFDSWGTRRAVDYRNFHKIPHDLGTAVNIVAMVFGNLGDDSGTGVAFTRDPATGARTLYGEYLVNAQGEDVVAGMRTPQKISDLERAQPRIYAELQGIAELLERHYRDAQDIEFTVERGRLYVLQTRSAKRTAAGAVRMAVEMEGEGLITREEAILRVDPEQITQLLLPRFDDEAKEDAVAAGRLLATGLNASPGAACGRAIFDADRAVEAAALGEAVILVRPETNPDDVHGMLVARGILTARGGATSHAAVVARGLGKPCVTGVESLAIDLEERRLSVDGTVIQEDELLSVDGATGEVFAGRIATVEPDLSQEHDLQTLLGWADKVRRLGVWANADYPRDAERAVEFGAGGIGLCRTEHMFFEQNRLPLVRRMILAAGEAQALEDEMESLQAQLAGATGRRRAQLLVRARAHQELIHVSASVRDYHEALDRLQEIQQRDFEGVLGTMAGKPVIIRLLDPPLHEFLPRYDELLAETVELRTLVGVATGDDIVAALTEIIELRTRGGRPELLRDPQDLRAAVDGLIQREAGAERELEPSWHKRVRAALAALQAARAGGGEPQAAPGEAAEPRLAALLELLPALPEIEELDTLHRQVETLAEKEHLLAAVEAMRETNPMLGLRGCRLGILHPAIYEMQVRAIIAAAAVLKGQGVDARPEIMIPLVGHEGEIKLLRERLAPVAEETQRELGATVDYLFGTMIEVPRAAVTAGAIARHAEFFSFGTNDLTQTTYAYSRDDAEGKFLLKYVQDRLLPENPFQTLDIEGVGRLIEMAVKLGRETRSDLAVGICGEHGGDPESIRFCHRVGLDYVSCSPFRVPVARLAAAQAAIAPVERDR